MLFVFCSSCFFMFRWCVTVEGALRCGFLLSTSHLIRTSHHAPVVPKGSLSFRQSLAIISPLKDKPGSIVSSHCRSFLFPLFFSLATVLNDNMFLCAMCISCVCRLLMGKTCQVHVIIIFVFLKVMPQLLNSLSVDSTGASIDWGTLVVYACSDSCNHDDKYRPEFIWKQDFGSEQHTQIKPT